VPPHERRRVRGDDRVVAETGVVHAHLALATAERGHGDVRAAHGAVFQYLDETGTTVSALAERAQITKQAMAELVHYLEARGYVIRKPDPDDRRAKLVVPTERGREVVAIAQDLVPQLVDRITTVLGAERVESLRADLDTIRRIATS
jgi:DNA-binding MarR family transcriptional regulator